MSKAVLAFLISLVPAMLLGLLIGPTPAPAAEKVLKVGFVDGPQGMDPALAVVGASHQIIDLVYSGLTKLNNDAKPIPDLAESWTVEPDGKTYTFELRSGVKFHDGQLLTADDVVYTFKRLTDPKTGYAYATQVESIADVVALDPLTVQFKLSKPTGPFLTFLAFPGNFIVPKHVAEAGSSLTSKPIGTGPFKFVSYSPDQELVLEANRDYYVPGIPTMDKLDIKYYADDTERANALLGGSIDFATRVGAKDYDGIIGTKGFAGTEQIGGRWFWIMTQDKDGPTKDPLVRQAISYALDRQEMADTLFFGHAKPILGGPIPDWSWAYDKSTDVVSPHADLEKAKALLKQAGYPDGLKIDMILGTTWKTLADQGPLIKDQLARAGIDVNLVPMENPRYMDLVWGKGQFQISNMYWLSPLADPDDFTYLNYRCGSGMNPQKYCNSKLDELLQQARYTSDQGARKALYTQATQLLLSEMPLIPTVTATMLDAYSTKVKGWSPMRTGMYRNLSEVTLGE
jgi:peptide/nickel transport system substrate-binding protein